MKIKNKVLLSCFSAVAVLSLAALAALQFITPNASFNGIYSTDFEVLAEEENQTNPLGVTMGMYSNNKEYLLLATSFNVDNVANYKELGYKITVNGGETQKLGAGNTYYTGISVKTGESTSKDYILGENIYANVEADGMIVAETVFDTSATYVIEPYIISNEGVESVNTAINIGHTHELSLNVKTGPTNAKIASYGTLNTNGLVIEEVCATCDYAEDVTAACVQQKYEHGEAVTFTYGENSVNVPVTEVTGYEVKVTAHSGCAIGTGELSMNKMPEGNPADEYKASGYVCGTTSDKKFQIHKEVKYYVGEYAGVDLYKVGNFDASETLTYFVYSEVAGTANISVLVSDQRSSAGEVPAKALSSVFNAEVNGEAITISPTAKTKAFTATGSYQMDFSYVTLTAQAQLNEGWNTVAILPISGKAQLQMSTMKFDFVQKTESKRVILVSGMGVKEEPTEQTLAGKEDVGEVYLVGKEGLTIAEDGGVIVVKNGLQGSVVTYYVYLEKDVTATVNLTGSASGYYASSGSGTPDTVRLCTFGTDITVKVNGQDATCADTALFPEYHVSTPTWSVCHNFMTITLLENVELHE
ncbi:MAG: hypothetical protein J6B04_02700, partial [Clostridia bacterium]|nr:hypothetical protein [Clostridia bacterium]